MMRRTTLLLTLAAAAVLVVGCSDTNEPRPVTADVSYSGVLRGEIPGDAADFELGVTLGKNGHDDPAGTLLVRGRNISYDDENGVLSVDLTLVNDGGGTYPEPVSLTFLQLLPAGVTVLEADNGETGAGASYAFEFDDDDGMWTPGEESLPRTAMFGVEAGTSIGFMARVDVAQAPDGGTIGGMVWHDMDEDGEMDDGEPGEGGVTISLHAGEETAATPMQSTTTADDGTYRFDGLAAGYYTVMREARDDLRGTTPARIAVILVDDDGMVSDFLLANFGVVPGNGGGGDDDIQVGDYVHAKGWYQDDPHRLVAEILDVCHCDDPAQKHDDDDDDDRDRDRDDCDDCDDDCDDGCRENSCWGVLAGPVTGGSLEDRTLEIMGTPVHFMDKCDCDDHHPGMRVRVKVYRNDDGDVVACGHLRPFRGNWDRVAGFVQEVVRGDDDRIVAVVVLNTLIVLEDGWTPPVPGSIGGTVWNDLNGDGVRDEGEAGIPGIGIELSGAATGTATTDENGAYVFADLLMGDYTVVCLGAEGVVPTTPDTLQIMLGDGEMVEDADFGWQAEAPEPGSIGGVVWNDVNGDGVRDEGEAGVAGIGIELSGEATGMATTDENGAYTFGDLLMGDYTVICLGTEGFEPTTPDTLQIMLGDAEVVDDADFGWQEMVPVLGSR